MAKRSAAVLVVLLVVGLAGCSGPPGPPWPEAVSPTGITLRWYSDDVSEAEAHQIADAHCSSATGQGAAVAAVERDGSAEIARYRCR